MCAVILADRDPLYAWFVTEALLAEGVQVTWFRSATPAVAWAARHGTDDRVLLVDAVTWLSEPQPAAEAGRAVPGGAAVLLGWDTDRQPPAGFAIQREKPDDAAALRRLVAGAARSAAVAAGASESSPGAAG